MGPTYVEWQRESGFQEWNVYRGSLRLSRVPAAATRRSPARNPLAAALLAHAQASPGCSDLTIPQAGRAAFYPVSGDDGGSG